MLAIKCHVIIKHPQNFIIDQNSLILWQNFSIIMWVQYHHAAKTRWPVKCWFVVFNPEKPRSPKWWRSVMLQNLTVAWGVAKPDIYHMGAPVPRWKPLSHLSARETWYLSHGCASTVLWNLSVTWWVAKPDIYHLVPLVPCWKPWVHQYRADLSFGSTSTALETNLSLDSTITAPWPWPPAWAPWPLSPPTTSTVPWPELYHFPPLLPYCVCRPPSPYLLLCKYIHLAQVLFIFKYWSSYDRVLNY